MKARRDRHFWLLLAALPALCLMALLIALSPMGLAPRAFPMPDLVYVVLATWLVRRPDAAPLLMVFAIGVVSDLMRGAPLGIGTLCLLGIAELLRHLSPQIRRGPFVTECLLVMGLFTLKTGIECLALWLTFSPRPQAGQLVLYIAGTALLYPPVCLALTALFRLRTRRPESERLIA